MAITITSSGTFTVVPGETYIIAPSVDGEVKFEYGSGSVPVDFTVEFQAGGSEGKIKIYDEELSPTINVADGADLTNMDFDLTNAASTEINIGDNATLGKIDGSKDGPNSFNVGDNNSFLDYVTMGDDDDTIDLGDGNSFTKFDAGSGNDTMTTGDDTFFDTLDMGKGGSENLIIGGLDLTTDEKIQIIADNDDDDDVLRLDTNGGDEATLIQELIDNGYVLQPDGKTWVASDGAKTLDWDHDNNAGTDDDVEIKGWETIILGSAPGPVDGLDISENMGPGYTDLDGDQIDGTDGIDDTIFGNDGDDTIDAALGDDTVDGGEGDDVISGGVGNNLLSGGGGDDVFVGGDGADTFQGDADQDNLDYSGSDAAVQVNLTDGTLSGGDADNDSIAGGIDGAIGSEFGDELIGFNQQGTNPSDIFTNQFFGEGGDDTIEGRGGNDLLDGGDDNDLISGGSGNDLIDGGDGDDTIDGGDDNDTITGGDGSDVVTDTDGDNVIDTSGGDNLPDIGFPAYGPFPAVPADPDANDDRDLVTTGDGNDDITTGDDADTISSGGGDDTIDSGIDDDVVDGGAGNDEITSGEGNDSVLGGDGDDTIFGGLGPSVPDVVNIPDAPGSGTFGPDPEPDNGDDTLDGGAGNDVIFGEDDSDLILGGTGNDTLDGGIDDDTIDGGKDDDEMTGGDGNDVFIETAGEGADTITDFGVGDTGPINDGDQTNNDFVDLSGFYNASTVADVNAAGGSFGNALGMLREDAADGTIDGVIDGTDYSAEIGDVDLTLEDGSGGSVTDTDLTFDNTNVVCFVRGTQIATRKGGVDIENLKPGDEVITMDHGFQKIRWIGSTKVPATGHLAPIVIRKGAMGNERDLRVSPQHRMLVRGWHVELMFGKTEALVPAKALINDETVFQLEGGDVEYFHVMFDRHELIYAEGIPSESFHPGHVGMGSFSDETRDEILHLFPDLREDVNNYPETVRPSLKVTEARVLAENPELLRE